jgi:predicted GNAT family N-acyltransferase
MRNIVSRPYFAAYKPACLAVFDSNVPTFFASAERPEFCEHLASVGAMAPYLAFLVNDVIVACGGLTIDAARHEATLSWGMVARECHRQGLGTHITEARLALARSIPGLDQVILSTCQHTHGFYGRFGFTVSGVTPEGLGTNLDRWDMVLRLR